MHRDIKPDNILLSRKRAFPCSSKDIASMLRVKSRKEFEHQSFELNFVLADLGFATQHGIKLEEEGIICGTPGYFAPELLNCKPLTTKADIFSVGCVLYKIISGNRLFDGNVKKQVLLLNKECLLPGNFETDIESCSIELKGLLISLLNPCPEKRPTAYQALNHSFFKNISQGIKICIDRNREIEQGLVKHHQSSLNASSVRQLTKDLATS